MGWRTLELVELEIIADWLWEPDAQLIKNRTKEKKGRKEEGKSPPKEMWQNRTYLLAIPDKQDGAILHW